MNYFSKNAASANANEYPLIRTPSEELRINEAGLLGRLFFTNSPIGTVIADAHRRVFLQVNPAMCSLFGYSEDEFCHLGVPDIHPPEFISEIVERFDAIAQGMQQESLDTPCVRKDKTQFFADILTTCVQLDIGLAVIGFFTDVTERHHAQRIQQAERDLGLALGQCTSLDEALNICLDQALSISQMEAGSIYLLDENDGSLHSLVHRGLSPDFINAASVFPQNTPNTRLVMQGKTQSFTADQPEFSPRVSQEGLQFYSIVPVTFEGRTIGCLNAATRSTSCKPVEMNYLLERVASHIGAVLVHRKTEDALKSSQKQAEQNLRQMLELEKAARQAAVDANQAKDTFLAMLSHELRTPLTAVLSWAQMIMHGHYEGERLIKAAKVIEHNAKAQIHMINDLLDLSRIVAGKVELEFSDAPLNKTIQAAIDSLQVEMQTAGVQIKKQFPADNLIITTDHVRLQQIVWNLLSNAVKFSAAGQTIFVNLEQTTNCCNKLAGAALKILVKDEGCGIARHRLEEIFLPFRQLDSGITRSRSGLGLGLAICQKLVSMMDGLIWADSDGEGKGASFCVCLPFKQVQEQKRTVKEQNALLFDEELNLSSLMARQPFKNCRFLLVDDEASIRESFAEMIKLYGGDVLSAASAEEAWDYAVMSKPHFALIDLAMPVEDGYSLLSRLREAEALGASKIIAIAFTAYAGAEERSKTINAGFDDYCVKPLEEKKLIATLLKLAKLDNRLSQ